MEDELDDLFSDFVIHGHVLHGDLVILALGSHLEDLSVHIEGDRTQPAEDHPGFEDVAQLVFFL